MRKTFLERIGEMLQRGERQLIRIMVLASILLVLVQLSLAGDPVKVYLSMAERVESPPLDFSETFTIDQASGSSQTLTEWKVLLKAVPASPVRIIQDGKIIGDLTKGQKEIAVHTGQVQLDATNVSSNVRIQVVKRDSQLHEPRLNQTFLLSRNKVTMFVSP